MGCSLAHPHRHLCSELWFSNNWKIQYPPLWYLTKSGRPTSNRIKSTAYSQCLLSVVQKNVEYNSCLQEITFSLQASSQGKSCLTGDPMAFSTIRMLLTNSANSLGSSDAWWSLPFQVLSKVMWRSNILAPIATAAIEMAIPVSWPE